MARARVILFLSLLAITLGTSAVADAGGKATRKVFLNGIDLDGVELPKAVFDSCTVEFDAKGNIHINAPGFKIEAKPADGKPATPPPGAKLTQHYFVIAREPAGASGYEVAIYVNGDKVATVQHGALPLVMDITRWVKAGSNDLRLLASKKSKRAGSAKQVLQVELAEGDSKKGEAIVRKTLIQYQRSAAEKTSFQHRYTFTAR